MRRYLNIESVAEIVCDHFGFKQKDIFKRGKKTEILNARQHFHYFANKYTKESQSIIADYLGSGYDHSTVIHSKKVVQNRVEVEKDFKESFNFLEFKINEFIESGDDVELNISVKKFREKLLLVKNREDYNNLLLAQIKL